MPLEAIIEFRDAVDLNDFIGSWSCIKGWIEGLKKGKEKKKEGLAGA
jgi:hypothetical protein